jgi:uncharacterized protein YigA (DUF484 family)
MKKNMSFKDILDYFIENPKKLEELNQQLEAPQSDFVKHRFKVYEEKIALIEHEKLELVKIASENSNLFQRAISYGALISITRNLSEIIAITDQVLTKNPLVNHSVYYIEDTIQFNPQEPSNRHVIGFNAKTSPLVFELANKKTPFCGEFNEAKIIALFSMLEAKQAKQIKSIATIPLRHESSVGTIILGSETKHFFNPSQNTDYLQAIGTLFTANVIRLSHNNG